MKKLTRWICCLLSTLCFSAASYADESKNIPLMPKDRFTEQHFLFSGFHLGYTYLNTDVASEVDKDGFHLGLKGLYSYYWKKFAFNGGMGWFYDRVSGNSAVSPVTRERVTTWGLFLELSPHYRISERFSVGPMFQILFGTDTDFGSLAVDSDSVTMFAGGQLAYAIPTRFPIRFTASVLTDLDISNRQVHLFLAGFQFGVPLKKMVNPLRALRHRPRVEQRDASVAVVFELSSILFDFDKDAVTPIFKEYLERVESVLIDHPKLWKELRIEGHADIRGSREYNMDLSRRRANSVKSSLMEMGIAEGKMQAVGYGFDRPVDPSQTEAAYAKNRRVELIFPDVDEPEKLMHSLQLEVEDF